MYKRVRRGLRGMVSNLKGPLGRKLGISGYHAAKKSGNSTDNEEHLSKSILDKVFWEVYIYNQTTPHGGCRGGGLPGE